MSPTDPREHARYLAVNAGRQSLRDRGLEEWDAEAMDAALEAERAYLTHHHIRQILPGEDVAECPKRSTSASTSRITTARARRFDAK